MELQRKKRPRRRYPANSRLDFSRISLYRDPPGTDFALEDTIRIAYHRLCLLPKLASGSGASRTSIWRSYLTEFAPSYLSDPTVADIAEKDYLGDQVSHFLLRAITAETDDFFAWFVRMEALLLRTRLDGETSSSLARFATENELQFSEADERELDSIRAALRACHSDLPPGEPYYKVPFTEVLDLVATRKVYLARGMAFVPQEQIASIILSRFTSELEGARPAARLAAAQLRTDGRFGGIIQHARDLIAQLTKPEEPSHDHARLKMAEIGEKGRQSFPLCMADYHSRTATAGSIDHTGFLQYTSFLRSCGAQVHEVSDYLTRYYQSVGRSSAQLSKKKYDIRHIFGMEGQMKPMASYKCRTIVLSTDKQHGCPFRSFSGDSLVGILEKKGIPRRAAEEIAQGDTTNHCQLACGRVFDILHECPQRSTNIQSPADYYHQSNRVIEENVINVVDWDEEMEIIQLNQII